MDKILEKAYYKEKITVVTKKKQKNVKGTLANMNMPDSSHSKPDTRIILHVYSCGLIGLTNIYVQINDADGRNFGCIHA